MQATNTNRATNAPANILTAQEFIAQGTTAGAIMSIAEHEHQPIAIAERLRATARTVASLTGQSLRIPGAITSQRRAANDNRRHKRGSERRAA